MAQALPDLEAVASGVQQDDVLRAQLGGGPRMETDKILKTNELPIDCRLRKDSLYERVAWISCHSHFPWLP
jgi:hypothetical protein